jgi:VCBS repeat-containing protein
VSREFLPLDNVRDAVEAIVNFPLTPEASVNIFTSGAQNGARITTLADGRYVIVWQSQDQGGSGSGVFAQLYSAQGQRLGPVFPVNSTQEQDQSDPDIAATEDGGFVVVWESVNQDVPGTFQTGIISQRYDATGAPVGGERIVNTTLAGSQIDPSVSGLPGGGHVVVWGDGNSAQVRGQLFDPSGAVSGSEFVIAPVNGSRIDVTAILPSAGANGIADGGFAAVFANNSTGLFNVQAYDVNGAPVGALTALGTTSGRGDPSVVGLSDGRFAVVWDQFSAPGDNNDTGVLVQIFEGDGTSVFGPLLVNQEISSTQSAPAIAAFPGGGFVVLWESQASTGAGDGSGLGVIGRRFDNSGAPLGDEFIVNEETASTQNQPAVAVLPTGEIVAAWTSVTSGTAGDGSGDGVFQRLFGDPETFVAPSASPDVEAVSTLRVFAENAFETGAQRLDIEGAAAVSDADSADFAGGRLILSRLSQSVAEDDFPAQDADGQDSFSFETGGRVSISGADVSVDGVLVGTLTSDGQAGAPLILTLTAGATPATVEVLVEHLTYRNLSDDPRPETTVSLLLEDGDGAASDPVAITIRVEAEPDADGPIRGERQVNSFFEGEQTTPQVAPLADGGYVVVWASTNQDNPGDGDTGVFAQRFDANGAAVGAEFQVNFTTAARQFEPQAAGLADGGFVIVWSSDVGDASGRGVILNRYDSAGARIVTEEVVNTQTQSTQDEPSVAALSAGGFVVTWTSQTSGPAGDGFGVGVFAQSFNAAGGRVGGEVQVNVETASSQSDSHVAGLSGGRFAVVFTSETSGTAGDGSLQGVFLRLFGANGLPEGGELLVNTFTHGGQNTPRIAALDGGGFVVVWRSEGQDGSSGGVYARRYDDSGATLGDEIRVNDLTSGNQTEPDVIGLAGGGFAVSWTDTSTPAPGSGSDPHVQVFDADGTRVDSARIVNTTVLSTQDSAALAPLPVGGYVVVWRDANGLDGSGSGVFQQIFGDPSDFDLSSPPLIEGLPETIVIGEGAANAGAPLVPSGAINLTDADSPDFGGGRLTVTRIARDENGDDFNAPDGADQDMIFVAAGGRVAVAGGVVSVDGVAIGAISGGVAAASLVVDFNAAATIDRVEAAIRALSYANTSDNPRDERSYSITLTDGDGSVADPIRFTIRLEEEPEPGAFGPVGGESQVNEFTFDEQTNPKVAVLADGGWAVVWQSTGQDGDSNGVFLQRYDSEGNPAGPETQVNLTTARAQDEPDVAALEGGGFVVVWTSNNQDVVGSNDDGVLARVFDASGAATTGEIGVNAGLVSRQDEPSVTGLPGGGFAVAFTTSASLANGGDGSSDGVLFRLFDGAGAPTTGDIRANEQTLSTQDGSFILTLADGRILVTWVSVNAPPAGDGSGNGVFARLFSATGAPLGGEFQVNQETSSSQDKPSAAALADGGFVIAWGDSSVQDGSGIGVSARRFGADGLPASDEFVVNETRNSTQDDPAVIALADGGFVIGWQGSGAGDSSGVFAQRYDASGARVDGELLLNEQTQAGQNQPALAALPEGGFVALWTSQTSGAAGDGSGSGVFQRIFGDPADVTPGAAPIIEGFEPASGIDPADFATGLARIDLDGAIAVADLDSADFGGGRLTLAVAERGAFNGTTFTPTAFAGGAAETLGLIPSDRGGGDVQVSGTDVTVDGVSVGTIVSDGAAGAPFEILLSAGATAEAVEALLGALGYRSTAPDQAIRIRLDLSDGDGTSAPTQFHVIETTPQSDIAESQVNTFTTSTQDTPTAAPLADGGYVVIWQSTFQDDETGNRGIYAQRFNAAGEEVGPEFRVNDIPANDQIQPSAAGLSGGGFVISWTENGGRENSGAGVFAQVFDAAGARAGAAFQINEETRSTQDQGVLTPLSGGGFLAVWSSNNSGSAGDGSGSGVFGRVFTAEGASAGGEFQINTTTALSQFDPAVATLANGDVIVTWTDNGGADGNGSGIFAQRVAPDGSLRSRDGAAAGAEEFRVSTTTTGAQENAQVTALPGGGFVVVWESPDGSGDGIFAQVFNASGAVVGGQVAVNQFTSSSQFEPMVSATPDGGFLVAWTDFGSNPTETPNQGSGAVIARRFDATGAATTDEFLINVETQSTQNQPALATLANGAIAAIWVSATSGPAGDGNGSGVFQRLLDLPSPAAGAGAPAVAGFEPVSVFDEASVNSGLQLLAPSGAVAVIDPDSADFDGGSLLLFRQPGVNTNDEQLGPLDGPAQDSVGIVPGGGVTVSGAAVSVGGVAIGTIMQDGQGGAPLEIVFSSTATPAHVEALVARLGYASASDAPDASRNFALQITDGDGGSTGSIPIRIEVTPDADLTVAAGPETVVNSFTENAQNEPQMATLFDAAGNVAGHVVVWTSQNQDQSDQSFARSVFAQTYGLDGAPTSGEILVNVHRPGDQFDPVVTGLAAGGFVVAWNDSTGANPTGDAAGENGSGIYGRIFANDGAELSGDILLNDEPVATQSQPAITALPGGGFVVGWTESGTRTSSQDVFYRLFDDFGAPQGTSSRVSTEIDDTQGDLEFAALADGGFVAVWESTGQDNPEGLNLGVFAQRFDAAGVKVGAEFQVNTNVVGRQFAPVAAGLADGGFVVAWEDSSGLDGAGTGVFQQRYDASGAPVGGEERVSQTISGTQSEPAIIALETGGWVVGFQNGGFPFVQAFAADGGRVDDEVRLPISNNGANGVSLAGLAGEGFAAAWNGFSGQDGSSTGVIQRVFSATPPSAAPEIAGLPETLTLDEAAVSAGPVLLFPSLAFGDADSANLAGGEIRLTVLATPETGPNFPAPDGSGQDAFSLLPGGGVTLAGSTVSVGGVAVGEVEAGFATAGATFTIRLNANATPAAVEAVIERLAYSNNSDDPAPTRLISFEATDGEGGALRRLVEIGITPEIDGREAIDGEQQVNSFTTGEQGTPAVAALADGGHVVVWTSTNQDATGDNDRGVFAQRFDASGAPVGGEFLVNVTTASAQFDPQVAGLAGGGFAVLWEDFSGQVQSAFPAAVARIFDASGAPVSGEINVTPAGSSNANNPMIAAAPGGGFAVVSQISSGALSGQVFNAAGGAQGLPFTIPQAGNGALFDPVIAVREDGRFAVAYTATNLDNPGDSDQGIFIQTYAADGSAIGVPQVVNDIVRASQFTASIAATAEGYVVAFVSDNADGSGQGVLAQRFDANGGFVGDNFLVNELTQSTQNEPIALGLPGGGFAIAYTDFASVGAGAGDGSGEVRVQQYAADGSRIDDPIRANVETQSTQSQPALAALTNGAIVAVWRSETSGPAGDGSGGGVFSRIIGDLADFSVDGAPVLDGVNAEVVYRENTVNGVPQLIDANGAAAVSDPDSANFEGGSILVSNIIASAPLIDQINPPDDLTQDVLGLRQGPRLTILGDEVQVDGAIVATIAEDGQAGRPFRLDLSAAADAEVVEFLVENLTYRNLSDDPLPERLLRIQITDGDGGASEPVVVRVRIEAEPDGATPLGGERQVNTFETGAQNDSATATLADGGFVIVWRSEAQDGASGGIFGQRFDALGNPTARDGTALASGVTDEFLINATTAGNQSNPDVAALGDGFVVTFEGPDASSTGVYARRFGGDGQPLDAADIALNALTSSTQSQPQIVALDGGFVAVWRAATSAGSGDGSGGGIAARLFDAAGAPLASEFVVNTETLNEQSEPAVTRLADGGFFVSWHSQSDGAAINPTADGSGFGIFGQRFDAAGAAVGDEIQLNFVTAQNQRVPEIATLANGDLIVVWTDDRLDGSGVGVFARIFGPDGAARGDQFRVNDERISTQDQPDVAALETGGFIVVWTDFNVPGDPSGAVLGQQYAADGLRVDGQFLVNTETSGTQDQPAVTGLPGGGFVVSWTSNTSGTAGDGSGGGVFYRVYGNEAPTISPVSAEGNEDEPIVLGADVFDAGFVDPDGQALQFVRIETLPTQGALTLAGAPVTPGLEISRAQLLNGDLVYLGGQDFFGTDDFLWTGSDGLSFSPDVVVANINVAPVNDAPALEAGGNADALEGGLFTRQLTIGDPDPDLRTITVDFGDGSAPVVFNSAQPNPTISHIYGPQGVFTVTVTVNDNSGAADAVEVDTFEVTVLNAPPVADPDPFTVSEDAASFANNVITPTSQTADRDPGGDPITVVAVNGLDANVGQRIALPSGAFVTLNADGSFVYEPDGAFESLADFQNGTDSFTYAIADDEGLRDTATVFLTIDGQNDAPVAGDDSFTSSDDSPISGNVLANDSDVDAQNTLTVVELNGSDAEIGLQVTLASGALLTLNADGTFDYDPNGAFPDGGEETFAYRISDGRGGFDEATVTIVNEIGNRAPIAADDAVTTDEETALAGNVLADNGNGPDADPDGDLLTVTQVNGAAASVGQTVTLASGATLRLNADGSFDYDPNGAFEALGVGASALDGFTYTISDGNGGSDQGAVSVTVTGVNDDPNAGFVSVDVGEDGPAVSGAAGAALAGSTDVDAGDVLRVTEVNGSTLAVGAAILLPSGARLTLNADGSFDYDPNGAFESLRANDTAFDNVSVTVGDGQGGSDIGTLRFVIDGANDAPVAQDDAFSVTQNGALSGDVRAANGAGIDFDPDSGETAALVVSAVNGAAADIGRSIALASGATLTLNASGTFAYDPSGAFDGLGEGETGTDSFTYTIRDPQGAEDVATVTISVAGANDGPDAIDDLFATDEDGAVSGDVLGNDVDPDGDALTVTAVNGAAGAVGQAILLASGARLTLNVDGTFDHDPNGAFEALAAGAAATESFNYTVSDPGGLTDTATATVTIAGVNDAPDARNDVIAALEDAPVSDNVLANNGFGADADVDAGDVISVIAVNGVAANVGARLDLAGGGAVTVGADGALAFDPDGDFEFLGAGETRDVTFAYTIADLAGATDTAAVTVRVTGANDAPAAADDAFTIPVNAPLSGNVLANNGAGPDTDPDANDVLTVVAINGSPAGLGTPVTLASGAVVTLNADGAFTYDASGAGLVIGGADTVEDGFTYTLSDGTVSDVGAVTITLTVPADGNPPVAADDAFTTDEDNALFDNLLANDSDLDLDTLTVTAVNGSALAGTITLASGALLTVNADGTFAYDPNGVFEALAVGTAATDGFIYTITDGSGFDTASVTITVEGVNDAPVAADDSFTTDEDSPLSGAVLGNDSDVDEGDVLRVTAVNSNPLTGAPILLNSGALLTVNADGTFIYDPNGAFEDLAVGQQATELFSYSVSDGVEFAGAGSGNVTITIEGVNDAPIAENDTFTVGEDSVAEGFLIENDFEVDSGDVLFVVAINGVELTGPIILGSGATLIVSENGNFNYDPSAAFNSLAAGDTATDGFEYTISDANGGFDTASVTITIEGVNDEPVAVDDLVTTTKDNTVTGSALANDFDVDEGDILRVVAVEGAPITEPILLASGALMSMNADGTFSYDPNGAFDLLGTGETATEEVTYTVEDANGGVAEAQIVFTITGLNNPPTGSDATFATDEDTDLAGDLIAASGATDADPGDTLRLLAINGQALTAGQLTVTFGSGAVLSALEDGTFSLTVAGNYDVLAEDAEAAESVSFTIADAAGASFTASATITITGVNDAPVANDDEAATDQDNAVIVALPGNDFDPDAGDEITLAIADEAGSAGGALLFGEEVVFDPNGEFDDLAQGEARETTFIYTIRDGSGAEASATLTVTVTGLNDTPTGGDAIFTTDEDSDLSGDLLAASEASDVDNGDTLRLVAINGQALTAGQVSVTFGSGAVLTTLEDGTFDLTVAGNYDFLADGAVANEAFSFTVADTAGANFTASSTITITGVNDAPIAVDDAFSTDEDTGFTTGNVLANDLDVDIGDMFEVVGVNTAGTLGLVTDNGDGTFFYDPNGAFEALSAGESATDSFFYTIRDGGGLESTAEVVIAIEGRDEEGGLAEVAGNAGRNVLVGTAADELFLPGGGNDLVTTGGGADVILFQNVAGRRDVLTVTDFDPLNDALDLGGAGIVSVSSSAARTILVLEGPERDSLILNGVSFDDLVFV